MLFLGGSLSAAFAFLSKDDDHFSPEADAAMSEMTGNTALLAQVCGGSWMGHEQRLLEESVTSLNHVWASWELIFKFFSFNGLGLG